MQTTALIDQSALLIGLKEYLQDVLGDTHYQPIGYDRAEAIVKLTGNSKLCFVQFPSEDCPEISAPLLWKYSAWADSVERNRIAKERANKARIIAWIREENIIRIKRAILRICLVSPDQAHLLACRMHDKKQFAKIASFGITLATKESDL